MESKDKRSLEKFIATTAVPQVLAGPPHLARTSHLHHPLAFQSRHFSLRVHCTSKFYEAPLTSAFKFPRPAQQVTLQHMG